VRTTTKIAAATALALSLASLTATTASAAIACNREGYCWHVRRAWAYQPAWGVVVHPDNWRWGPTEHFAWREHPGRGYWRNGVWIRF
jgi:hypothetical protein